MRRFIVCVMLLILASCTAQAPQPAPMTPIDALAQLNTDISLNNVTTDEFEELAVMLQNNSHASDELEEIATMMQYNETKHAAHSVGLLMYYVANKKDLICLGHALSHYYVFARHGEEEKAADALAEAKETLPEWKNITANENLTSQNVNIPAALSLIQTHLDSIKTGNTTASDDDIDALAGAYCASA